MGGRREQQELLWEGCCPKNWCVGMEGKQGREGRKDKEGKEEKSGGGEES